MSHHRVLVIEHEAQCPPGWVGQWLVETGAELDLRRPYRGDPLPETLAGHAAYVVLGGAMSATDQESHPWLPRVCALARDAVARATPTLGICLGHQLLALGLGGSVRVNPRGQQVGLHALGWRPEAHQDALVGGLTDVGPGVQWNDDLVDTLPAGAVLLAATEHGEVQVVRYAARAWGVQLHPEVGADIVRAWAENDRDDCVERGVDVDAHLAAIGAAEPRLRADWRRLVEAFMGVVHAAGVAEAGLAR